MKQDFLNKILERSKGKNDGVYSASPYYYSVKNGCPEFFGCKYSGQIHQFSHGFLVSLGRHEPYYKVKDKIKELAKR